MASEFDQQLLARVHRLAPERQREVLNFIEALERRTGTTPSPLPRLGGLGVGKGECPSEADIDAARREMWGDFPRGDL